MDPRPFRERKAALNLAQLAQSDAVLCPDRLANLIATLTVWNYISSKMLTSQAEAPTSVQKMYDSIPPPDDRERQDLELLIVLAQRRLQS